MQMLLWLGIDISSGFDVIEIYASSKDFQLIHKAKGIQTISFCQLDSGNIVASNTSSLDILEKDTYKIVNTIKGENEVFHL